MSHSALESETMLVHLQAVRQTMRALVHAGPADLLGPIVQEHLDSGGKQLRARLAVAATLSLGGSVDAAVAWGAACELAHNATLVHDDVQDGDAVRRGRPTTWVRHGVAQAINAGDLLFMLPYMALQGGRLDPAVCWGLCQALAQKLGTVIRGQAMECDLLRTGRTDRQTYEATIRGKTSALFELPVFGAALIAGAPADDAQLATAPFAPLGMLFQMQDDVLDLYGDKGREAPGADLREGKISALVVEHLERAPADTAWLLGLLRTPREQTSTEQVQAASDRFVESGAVEGVLTRINAQALSAQARVSPPLSSLLHALVTLVLRPIAHVEAVHTAGLGP